MLGPIDLQVTAGRVLVVLGPSGAGKTLLLATIAGLRPSQSGQVRLAGRDLTPLPPDRRRVGLVFQDGALFPHLSVRENIRFGPKAGARSSVAVADQLLDRLGIAGLAGRAPRSLSGGERQRVALARALAIQPELLLLDEPLSALDQPTREELRAVLQQVLGELAIPAVHVTHDRDEAFSLADDIAVIAGGAISQTGPAGDVAASPGDQVAARLLGWAELGRGSRGEQVVRVGEIDIAVGQRTGQHESAHVFYRPEEVLLGPPVASPSASAGRSADIESTRIGSTSLSSTRMDGTGVESARIEARIERIAPTVPLARITLASSPPVTALLLHRDVERLGLAAGAQVTAVFPAHAVRVFAVRD